MRVCVYVRPVSMWFVAMCYECLRIYDLPVIWLKVAHANSRKPIIKFLGIFASLLIGSLKSVFLGVFT